MAEPFLHSEVPLITQMKGIPILFRNTTCICTTDILCDCSDANMTSTTEATVSLNPLKGSDNPTAIDKHQTLQWPFIITSIVALAGVILLLSRFFKCQSRIEDKPSSANATETEKQPSSEQIPSLLEGASKQARIAVVVVVALVMFGAEGCENTIAGYLRTFLLGTDLQLTHKRSLRINATYNGTYALFRGIGVFLALSVKPVYVIFADLFILLVSTVIFWVYHDTWELAVWFATILMGIGFSTVCGNLFSVASQFVTVTNTVGAILVLAGVSSSALYPWLIGSSVQHEPLVLIYQNFVSITATLFLFSALLFYVKLQTSKPMRDETIQMTKM
ncbi:hypothetical protein HDE_09843 [Halotydeus destructor]|nr:hypothetical protein HDE_09843 [Halotydeus destructor]